MASGETAAEWIGKRRLCRKRRAYETPGLETLASRKRATFLHSGVADETLRGVLGWHVAAASRSWWSHLRDPVYAAARAVVVQDGAIVIVTVLSAGGVFRPKTRLSTIGR